MKWVFERCMQNHLETKIFVMRIKKFDSNGCTKWIRSDIVFHLKKKTRKKQFISPCKRKLQSVRYSNRQWIGRNGLHLCTKTDKITSLSIQFSQCLLWLFYYARRQINWLPRISLLSVFMHINRYDERNENPNNFNIIIWFVCLLHLEMENITRNMNCVCSD